MIRVAFLLSGMMLFALMGLLSLSRRDPAPYFLEFSRSGAQGTGLQTCRMADGTSPEILTEPGAYFPVGIPQWSPDGEWLLFETLTLENKNDLFRVNIATREVQHITALPGNESFPAWSPDSQWIAFSNHDGVLNLHIYIMRADGGESQRLLSGLGLVPAPGWSPDGEWLVFHSSCTRAALILTAQISPCQSDDANIYLLRLADGHIQSLMVRPIIRDYSPAWSPDGQWVAFSSRPDDNSNAQIFRVRPDGSDLQPLTDDPQSVHNFPAWGTIPDLAWRPIILLMTALACLIFSWWKKP